MRPITAEGWTEISLSMGMTACVVALDRSVIVRPTQSSDIAIPHYPARVSRQVTASPGNRIPAPNTEREREAHIKPHRR